MSASSSNAGSLLVRDIIGLRLHMTRAGLVKQYDVHRPTLVTNSACVVTFSMSGNVCGIVLSVSLIEDQLVDW